jgi:DNA helicase II / ATP-dependent DNA helicase PcrA
MEILNLELEAGEAGGLKMDYEDNDAIKVMTVHAAKGLEFKHVFLVDLVDKRFPTINRGERISIPEPLVREKIPNSKDIHLEEERRLFYVAITRAKNNLYLTSAKDYGGVREKKVSRFIEEMDVKNNEINIKQEFFNIKDEENITEEISLVKYKLPERFSFSQLAAYANCPLQYKFAFILKIPAPSDKPSLIFGRVMHNVLKDFVETFSEGNNKLQTSLFDVGKKEIPSLDGLLKIYEKNWRGDGYNNKEEREKYYKKGKEILKTFYKKIADNNLPNVLFLEKDFSFKINDYVLKGKIDRVDKLEDGTIEIIDYKTGNPKEKLLWDDKKQLILYQLFMEQFLMVGANGCSPTSSQNSPINTRNCSPIKLSYYYLENGEKISFIPKDSEGEKLKLEIREEIEEIKKMNFTPKPSEMCKFCDFNGICEFNRR